MSDMQFKRIRIEKILLTQIVMEAILFLYIYSLLNYFHLGKPQKTSWGVGMQNLRPSQMQRKHKTYGLVAMMHSLKCEEVCPSVRKKCRVPDNLYKSCDFCILAWAINLFLFSYFPVFCCYRIPVCILMISIVGKVSSFISLFVFSSVY